MADAARVTAQQALTRGFRARIAILTVLGFLPAPLVNALRRLYRYVAERWLWLDPTKPAHYRRWFRRYDTLSARDRTAIAADIATFDDPPLISVVVSADASAATLESVKAQLYPHWQLCTAGEPPAGDYVAVLDAGDLLPPHALYLCAREICCHRGLDFVYSDEDRIEPGGGRRDPHFRSDWNCELYAAPDRLPRLAVTRKGLALDRIEPERVRHIPHILYHRAAPIVPVAPAPPPAEPPDPEPSVCVIIPTRDRLDLLSRCVNGVLNRTAYRNLEVLIVDNGSAEPETAAYLAAIAADPRVRVMRDDGPFNFARLNNRAAASTGRDILLFLNNDTEIVASDWLHRLVTDARRPEIGAVGAKLLYPDGRVQHGGVILGIGGIAAHFHLRRAGDDPGYFGRAVLPQHLSAVTAACLAMRRAVFEEVGGFDAEHLPVAFNDIDLCLRVRERGYLVAWTPHAVLIHHESASRGFRPELSASVYMRERWGPVLDDDPYYNPNLSLKTHLIRLAAPPRRPFPWRR